MPPVCHIVTTLEDWNKVQRRLNINIVCLLWQPLVTKLIEAQTINLKGRYHCGDHKRTQQGVSAALLHLLYNLQMVHATNN